ncbi:MAG: amino acid ABC transporter ATP-binding protein [Halanaerobiales bacterium]|nr:amino acid ABC transporter ATP-binding protein [Bacillota bacterium]HOA40664.1 amino acid ABC transporter ATP-binding protein [Halanaerobiales bacterium]HPZ63105.1 amino acid ABC transporter ATP-binding protein [Halanaerobiales bacterium]HQD04658.1 amino acid ABC transporter ATP-binding protein [Halanaerobiales bacterium]
MSKHLLRVENLYKRFGDNEVLKGISFHLDKGETKVIVGPSGTGKSTILNNINMLVPPDEGKIYLEDVEITGAKDIHKLRQHIGFVFQDFGLFNHLSAKGNVMIGLTRVKKMGKKEAEEIAMEELKRVGLENFADQYPAQLSGGQKQRVGIARALAMRPKLILFDEPTSALDPELTGEVLNVMRKLANEGMTMLIVTHEMGFARTVADELIFMEDGVILEQGSPEKLFTNPEHPRTREFLFKLSEIYNEGER